MSDDLKPSDGMNAAKIRDMEADFIKLPRQWQIELAAVCIKAMDNESQSKLLILLEAGPTLDKKQNTIFCMPNGQSSKGWTEANQIDDLATRVRALEMSVTGTELPPESEENAALCDYGNMVLCEYREGCSWQQTKEGGGILCGCRNRGKEPL